VLDAYSRRRQITTNLGDGLNIDSAVDVCSGNHDYPLSVSHKDGVRGSDYRTRNQQPGKGNAALSSQSLSSQSVTQTRVAGFPGVPRALYCRRGLESSCVTMVAQYEAQGLLNESERELFLFFLEKLASAASSAPVQTRRDYVGAALKGGFCSSTGVECD
jgi:hypothetical protein